MATLRPALFFLIVLSLVFPFAVSSPLLAEGEMRWSKVTIPADGAGGNWVLAKGSDISNLIMAIDGTLYASANPTGTTYRLFKSKDKGVGWAAVGRVTDTIVDIATAPDNAGIIYYATASAVYRSVDSGDNFIALPPNPGGAGSGNLEITGVAVSRLSNRYVIAIAVRDRDAGQYGSVYTLDENDPVRWVNTNIGNYDAYAVAFSPNFPADRELAAVITDEVDTWVSFQIWAQNWGTAKGNARLNRGNTAVPSPVAVGNSAVICFPDGYEADGNSGNSILFVGVNAGVSGGDVYRVSGAKAPNPSVAIDLNVAGAFGSSNIDITGLSLSGRMPSSTVIAGASQNSGVYLSRDGGNNWERSIKPPSGDSKTEALIPPDFVQTSTVYAVTSGTESAFSCSLDGGLNWNQLSLIDTQITSGGILDAAPSPNYVKDNTIFVLTTAGAEQSLWRSRNGDLRWERVFSSTLPVVDSLRLLKTSPAYGSGSETVYLAGVSGGNPAIWRSTDNCKSFNCYPAPRSIDVMTVAGESNIFYAGFDGISGVIYHSVNGGFFFEPGAICGTLPLCSIAVSPGYEKDKSILVGNTSGWVYFSGDNGASFTPLPPTASVAPLSGNISVAFDSDFSRNKTVYAASPTADKGIYRFVIGKSSFWERIDASLPTGSIIKYLAVSPEGVLYGANFKADFGLERSLDPSYELGSSFERVTRGLESGSQLDGIWLSGSRVWAFDKASTSLITLSDNFATQVSLLSPPNKAAGAGLLIEHNIKNVVLDWESISGVTSYRWQINTVTDFSAIPAGFEGETGASTANLPSLEPGRTYYWRVKATQPNSGPWSEKWSFTTSLGESVSSLELKVPVPAARDVILKPVFQWTAIAGAEGYELVVSMDASFANPVISRAGDFAIPVNVWESNIKLDYGTTYYWKARAVSSKSKSAWSAVAAFTTELVPSPSVAATPTPQSTPPSAASPEPVVRPAPEPPPVPESESSGIPDRLFILIAMLVVSVVVLVVTVVFLVTKLLSASRRSREDRYL